MNDTELHNNKQNPESPSARMYSSSLQPLLQSLLSTLANIDFAYECECEKISKTSPDIKLRIRVLERLNLQHEARRKPYLQQLAMLQEQIVSRK
ncbi:hypothetical protein AB4Y85_17455 [Microvirga sp. 2YAF29]|uniref:hypothetical protein n=1 Tax=Microvirga sp. 2YAF29 TaxID=3233031 RepID=UPI003F97F485